VSYILKRIDQRGGYVAPPGSLNSYTPNIIGARRFPTREAAEADRCVENEIILTYEDMVR
jgi:hypothetical protein